MPCQSLYHATAWGLPFVAAINGCKVVLPADRFDGASLQQLIQEEEVTFSGGVPTIWTMYLNHLARTAETTVKFRTIVNGGCIGQESSSGRGCTNVNIQRGPVYLQKKQKKEN